MVPTLTQTDRSVFTMRVPMLSPGEEFRVLMMADMHHDHADARHDVEANLLEQARAHKAPVCLIGDTFCCMQGKWDPRQNRNGLRPELAVPDYLDAVVRYNGDFLADYTDVIRLISRGNHETSVLKRHEVDLVSRLVGHVNARSEGRGLVQAGGYTGFVRFLFERPTDGGKRVDSTKVMYFDHGSGGLSMVSRGVTKGNRMINIAVADIYVTGHTHVPFAVPYAIKGVSPQGKCHTSNVVVIGLPSTKDEHRDGFEGWGVEKGFAPMQLGAYWLKFYRPMGGMVECVEERAVVV
jgi:hypothetical protein